MIWDAAAIARLEELWADLSIPTITIGEMLGTSKNAIIGKAHRLKLPRRPNYPYIAAKNRTKATLVPEVLAPIVYQPIIREGGITIMELNPVTCRWPLGETYDQPPYMYCGHGIVEGLAYCKRHSRMAYAAARVAA